MTGWVAEIGAEAGFLPRHLTSGGAAVCVWAGGEGDISHDDADAGEIRWVPVGFLLFDVQATGRPTGGPPTHSPDQGIHPNCPGHG